MPLDGDALPDARVKPRGERRRFRVVASPDRWAQIVRAKGDRCRLCVFALEQPRRAGELGVSADDCAMIGRRVTYHHLLPRSLGGADTESNIVPLGGTGTTGHHGEVESRRPRILRALAEALEDAEIAYLAEHAGENWPERLFAVRYGK
jgi:hypothetical protein